METKIFYFSATGNSLSVARSIAHGLGEAELISIPKVMQNHVDTVVPKLGLVFPVYVWGLPRIVVDFVKKLKFHHGQYIFAIATCGGTPGRTLIQLQKMLQKKGADLDAGFVVREVNNTPLTSENPLINLVRKLHGKAIPQFGKERLPEIVAVIKNTQKHRPETSSFRANFVGGLIYKLAMNTLKKTGRDYWVDEKCNLCQLCERICPRENIKIVNNNVSWLQNCEMCFACLLWCPQEAIQYKNVTLTKKRTHHPEVKINDVILR